MTPLLLLALLAGLAAAAAPRRRGVQVIPPARLPGNPGPLPMTAHQPNPRQRHGGHGTISP